MDALLFGGVHASFLQLIPPPIKSSFEDAGSIENMML